MKLLDWLLRRTQHSVGQPGVLRKDLKPGTLYRYLYAGHDSLFVGVVPPRHPALPEVACCYVSDNPGPGDLLTAVEVLWSPPESASTVTARGETTTGTTATQMSRPPGGSQS